MSQAPIPWIGLAALIAMFAIPFIPEWLFEGPRTVKHRPRRHVCGDCGAPWHPEHTCALKVVEPALPLNGEAHRIEPPTFGLVSRQPGTNALSTPWSSQR
jgi:hypothetical protein